jgi:putative MATE family efflux protein
MRHVAVMTATGAIGLMAVFVVDLLSLFWVSRLGDQAFKAAVGYVGLTTFFVMSINIGLTIAASATVSRALGVGDRARARRLAASTLAITGILSAAVAAAMSVFRDWGLATLLHAQGESALVASKFIAISMPANVPLALGMTLAGVLRAVGDARRAMYVTLSAGVATAVLDPLLIFGLNLGVYGAAWATVLSRLMLLAVGFRGAVLVHDLVARPSLEATRRDFGPIMAIGLPSIIANMATPIGTAYAVRVFSDLGEQAVAATAIIDRVSPVAFGVIFALTGSIGPIIGQNFGAGKLDRVRRALTDSFLLSLGYVLVAWGSRARRARARLGLRREPRERRIRDVLLPVWRLDVAVPGVPLRRQHGLQQPGLSAHGDSVQLGAGDARDDSVRHLGRALRRREGRHDGRRVRLRRVRRRRGRRRLRDHGAPREAGAVVSHRRRGGRVLDVSRPWAKTPHLHCRARPPI